MIFFLGWKTVIKPVPMVHGLISPTFFTIGHSLQWLWLLCVLIQRLPLEFQLPFLSLCLITFSPWLLLWALLLNEFTSVFPELIRQLGGMRSAAGLLRTNQAIDSLVTTCIHTIAIHCSSSRGMPCVHSITGTIGDNSAVFWLIV